MDISLNPSAPRRTRTATVDFQTREEAVRYAHEAEKNLDGFVLVSIEETIPEEPIVIVNRRHHRTTDGRLAYGR